MKERMKAHGAWLSGAPRRDVLRTRSDGRRLRGRAHMQQTGGCLNSLNDQRAAVTLTVARLRSTPGKRWRRPGRPVGPLDVVCMSDPRIAPGFNAAQAGLVCRGWTTRVSGRSKRAYCGCRQPAHDETSLWYKRVQRNCVGKLRPLFLG